MDISKFLPSFLDYFQNIEAHLREVLRQEKQIKSHALTRHGIIIKHYSVKIDSITISKLEEIRKALQSITKMEKMLNHELKKNLGELKKVEYDYCHKTNRVKQLPMYLNNCLRNSRLAIVRIDELINELENDRNAARKGGRAARLLSSFERMVNDIIKFFDIIIQISSLFENFLVKSYFEDPKRYGRVMNPPEFKRTMKKEVLSSPKDPTPVFDAPQSTVDKILAMSPDQRKNFFSGIGVVGGVKVVFFQTKLKPINSGNPIPQSNGLREYKFPKNTRIEILKAA